MHFPDLDVVISQPIRGQYYCLYWHIRGQFCDHMTCISQSEASIAGDMSDQCSHQISAPELSGFPGTALLRYCCCCNGVTSSSSSSFIIWNDETSKHSETWDLKAFELLLFLNLYLPPSLHSENLRDNCAYTEQHLGLQKYVGSVECVIKSDKFQVLTNQTSCYSTLHLLAVHFLLYVLIRVSQILVVTPSLCWRPLPV